MKRIEWQPTALCLALAGLAGSLAVASCQSEDPASGPTTASGQVVDDSGGQPVPRPPQVQLWQRRRAVNGGNLLSGGGAYAPEGSPQPVDGQGRFSFGFEAEAGHEYVLRAADGGLGYYTNWDLVPYLKEGHKNEGLRVPVAAPAWVRVDLVDELPKSRVAFYFSGFGELHINSPRDTTLVFPYLTGGRREAFIYWRITPYGPGPVIKESRTLTLAPLDTLTVRIPF